MKRANIASAKNNLSKLISEVQKGETVLIVNRDVPVARLEPAGGLEGLSGRIPRLVRDGVVSLPASTLDADSFLSHNKVRPAAGGAVDAVLAERDSGL